MPVHTVRVDPPPSDVHPCQARDLEPASVPRFDSVARPLVEPDLVPGFITVFASIDAKCTGCEPNRPGMARGSKEIHSFALRTGVPSNGSGRAPGLRMLAEGTTLPALRPTSVSPSAAATGSARPVVGRNPEGI